MKLKVLEYRFLIQPRKVNLSITRSFLKRPFYRFIKMDNPACSHQGSFLTSQRNLATLYTGNVRCSRSSSYIICHKIVTHDLHHAYLPL